MYILVEKLKKCKRKLSLMITFNDIFIDDNYDVIHIIIIYIFQVPLKYLLNFIKIF